MTPTRRGSVHLFRFAGVDLYLHWSWFLVAIIQIQIRKGHYSSFFWNVLEYLTLFFIVLMHEFGHSLACRQVGGKADQIVLWPLGGVAYVAPPPRPGATLWSIAAGPLVNVVLAPVLAALWFLGGEAGWGYTMPNFFQYVENICVLNVLLLCFNMLPIYPLDGGQILRSLLWFVTSRGRSLMIASIIGVVGVILLFLFFLLMWFLGPEENDSKGSLIFFGLICVFILLNCWAGFQHARILSQMDKMPRRRGYACPQCKTPPPLGSFWLCPICGLHFDTFISHSTCPQCGAQFHVTQCLDCGEMRPIHEWMSPVAPPPFPGSGQQG